MKTKTFVFLYDAEYPSGYREWYKEMERYIWCLAELLNQLGHRVIFLGHSHSTTKINQAGYDYFELNQYVADKKIQYVMLEFGAFIKREELAQLKHSLSAKLIAVRYGNAQYADIASLFIRYDLPEDMHHQLADVVWVPKKCAKEKYYLKALYQAPVYECPFLWSSEAERSFTSTKRPNIIVSTANNSLMSNALIPLAIVNEVAKVDVGCFDKAYVLNGMHFYNTDYFLTNIVANFEYLQSTHNKAFFLEDVPLLDFLAQQADVLISFQHENSLPPICLEAMSLGLPLVHNCDEIANCGFYYSRFDVQSGVAQTLRAISEFEPVSTAEHYQRCLSRYSCLDSNNLRAYSELLFEIL